MHSLPRILCVDDDPNLLAVLQAILVNAGYSVVAAGTASAALTVFASLEVNLVILDYLIPEIDGGMLAARMRRTAPELPIILYSAVVDALPETVLRQFSAVVEKGGPPSVLLKAVADQLRRPYLRAHQRYRFGAPISVRPHSQTRVMAGRSFDVSEAGLGASVEGDLSPGELVSLKLTLPSRVKDVTTTARVCYRLQARYGFRFVELGEPELQSIRSSLPQ